MPLDPRFTDPQYVRQMALVDRLLGEEVAGVTKLDPNRLQVSLSLNFKELHEIEAALLQAGWVGSYNSDSDLWIWKGTGPWKNPCTVRNSH